MKNITKKFPGVIANKNVNLKVFKGEIHGLLGENGAGKTTLMNILFGIYKQDEGEIIYKGKKVEFKSPKDAINMGIGMVHQHFNLVDTLTVWQNVILGHSEFVLKDEKEKLMDVMEKYGIRINLDARVSTLSVGEEQRVEILKALYRDAELLILDEPTAILTPQEVDSLFSSLKKMVKKGLTVIFITHKLKEALSVTDRITVLRNGEVVGVVETAKTNEIELARMMVGKEIVIRPIEKTRRNGKDALRIENVTALNDEGIEALKKVSLTVKSGEILGLAGVSGNGQKELEEVIVGVRRIKSGRIYLYDREISKMGVKNRIKAGISCIPEDRLGSGVAGKLSVVENLMLRDFEDYGEFSLDFEKMREKAKKLIEEFDIKTPSLDTPVSMLSGGNLQRLILARELSRNPRLLIASQPTRGLDVAGIEYVRKRIVETASNGTAVMLISEDLDEIFHIADRIAVIYEGEIRGVFDRDSVTKEEVGILMAGGLL
ncbi:heme ABC transporter ATP-binding protein [Archaeoglobales archaeon]|nr:MAG: heme ABC transporter ATP-binding protein [Archaeoglobales archaeon]